MSYLIMSLKLLKYWLHYVRYERTENRIWQQRLVDIGVVTAKGTMDWGIM